MRAMAFKYKDKANFITLNAMKPKNTIITQTFKVDGIPHIAFLDPGNEVKTALVGAVPKEILDKEISSLVKVRKLVL